MILLIFPSPPPCPQLFCWTSTLCSALLMNSGEKREKATEGPWFLWQWSPTLWKLSLSYSLATYRGKDATVLVFPMDRCVESFLPRELLDNSSQKGSRMACGSVLCSKQGQLWSQTRLFKALSTLLLKNTEFSPEQRCSVSLGQLLSCWTVLFMKMFLLICSLSIPGFHSCLLALLLLCTANP